MSSYLSRPGNLAVSFGDVSCGDNHDPSVSSIIVFRRDGRCGSRGREYALFPLAFFFHHRQRHDLSGDPGVASQLRDDGHGGGRLSGVNPVALGLTLFLTAVSAVLVAYTVVLLGVKLILSLKGPADEQKVETGRRKAYPAWLVNSLAVIYGALLVHPVVFLVAFAYGTLFGVPPVARASAGAPTTSGLEGGGETANFLGIWYVISLGILPVVASGIGAAVAIGVSYLLIHKGQKDFRNRSADS